jgi:redox-sensitive bicupin YhaK (pirin superfamily)
MFGRQIWIALPRSHEEVDPSFSHRAAKSLPRIEGWRHGDGHRRHGIW